MAKKAAPYAPLNDPIEEYRKLRSEGWRYTQQEPEQVDDAVAPQERSWGDAVTDTGRGLASGVGGLVKGGGALYGLATGDMDNAATELGDSVQQYWEEGQSQQLKDKRTARKAAIDSADGTLAKAGTALWETIKDPALGVDTVAANAATMLPGMALGRLASGAKAAQGLAAASKFGPASMAAREAALKAAGSLGTKVAIGTGAVQQGADVSQSVYEDAMKKPNEAWVQNPEFMAAFAKTDMSEESLQKTKHDFALSAARVTMPAATAISVGANMLPGANMLERALVGNVAKTAGKGGVTSVLKSAGKGALGEMTEEGLEEGGGAFVGNVAKSRYVDPNQDLSDSVGENAGMGMAGGLLMGGGGGAVHGLGNREQVDPAIAAAKLLADQQAIARKAAVGAAHIAAATPNSPIARAAAAANPLTPEEAWEKAQQLDAQAELDEANGVVPAPVEAAPVVNDSLTTPPIPTFDAEAAQAQYQADTLEAQKAYQAELDAQADAAREAIALRKQMTRPTNEVVSDGGFLYEGTQDGDVLNGMGRPYTVKFGALQEAKRQARENGGEWTIAPVFDGFVARKKMAAIDQAAHEAATSHMNDKPQPTDAMKAAGNYSKGHIKVHGMDMAIENPKGSIRSGVSPDGSEWSNTMGGHYGYFKGTVGNDKDHVDGYVGPNPESNRVFVIDQVNKDGSFDEHKVMVSYDTPEQAREAYMSSFEPGWTGLGAMTELPVSAFKSWVKDGVKKKPLGNIEQTSQPADLTREQAIANASGAAKEVLASGGTDADANRAATDSLIEQMAQNPDIEIAQDAPAAVQAAKVSQPQEQLSEKTAKTFTPTTGREKTAKESATGNVNTLLASEANGRLDSNGDSVSMDAKVVGDLRDGHSLLAKSFNGLNADVQSAVMRHMLRISHKPKILKTVIDLIPVDVVNALAVNQLSPEMLFHNPSMLKGRSVGSNGDNPVSIGIDAATSIVRVVASITAKNPTLFEFGHSGGLSVNADSTSDARIPSSIGVAVGLLDPVSSPVLGGAKSVAVGVGRAEDQGRVPSDRGPAGTTIDGKHVVTPTSDDVLGTVGGETPSVPPTVSKYSDGVKQASAQPEGFVDRSVDIGGVKDDGMTAKAFSKPDAKSPPQAETAAPAPRPKNWENNYGAASKVAEAMGIALRGANGKMKKVPELVVEIKARDADLSKKPPKVDTSAELVQKPQESDQVEKEDLHSSIAKLTEPVETTHAGLKIYPIKVKVGDKVEDRWGVQTLSNAEREKNGERQLGGDPLADTLEQAKVLAEQEVASAQTLEQYRVDMAEAEQARQKAVQDVIDAKRNGPLTPFLNAMGYTPMQAGAARKALAVPINSKDFGVLPKQTLVEKKIEAGYLPRSASVDKIKPMTRAQSNRSDQREQDAHEKKIKDGGKVTEYGLWKDDGGTQIGRYEYDYANYLIGQKDAKAAGVQDSENKPEITPSQKPSNTVKSPEIEAAPVGPEDQLMLDAAKAKIADLDSKIDRHKALLDCLK